MPVSYTHLIVDAVGAGHALQMKKIIAQLRRASAGRQLAQRLDDDDGGIPAEQRALVRLDAGLGIGGVKLFLLCLLYTSRCV